MVVVGIYHKKRGLDPVTGVAQEMASSCHRHPGYALVFGRNVCCRSHFTIEFCPNTRVPSHRRCLHDHVSSCATPMTRPRSFSFSSCPPYPLSVARMDQATWKAIIILKKYYIKVSLLFCHCLVSFCSSTNKADLLSFSTVGATSLSVIS